MEFYSCDSGEIYEKELTNRILLGAIEVHRHLGPGLLESVYEICLCRELEIREIQFQRQVALPLEYKGVAIECGYRADLIVEKKVVVELKCVEKILPVHEAQLLTYLRPDRFAGRVHPEFPLQIVEGWYQKVGFVIKVFSVPPW